MKQENDTQISFAPLIVGTMRLGEWGAKMSTKEYEGFIEECLEMGLNDFDHADIYGHYSTEEEFGQVLKQRPELRQKMQLTTKCGIKLPTPRRPDFRTQSYDSTKAHIISSAEQSLKNLSTDYLDLLLIHRPDFLMDPSEIAEAFETLRSAGKVLHFGVSNFTPSQFDLLNSFTPLVNNQVEISLTHLNPFEDGTLDQCLKHRIIPTAWSPLGGGAIFSNDPDEQTVRIQKACDILCEKYNAGRDQIILAWLLKHPAGIIPVLGTTKVSRIAKALESTKINLSHQEWYELWEASKGEPVP